MDNQIMGFLLELDSPMSLLSGKTVLAILVVEAIAVSAFSNCCFHMVA